MKTKPVVILSLTAAASLGAYVLVSVGRFVVPILASIAHARKVENALGEPRIYGPVAMTFALYCQSDPDLFPQYLGDQWLPEELDRLGGGWASVSTNGAHIEMGGGFHHFGYYLQRDSATSGNGTNLWRLSMYSEGSVGRDLTTVSLPIQAGLSPRQVCDRVLAGCDAQIRRWPDNPQRYQDKIEVHLRFGDVSGARRACADMLKALPDDWWAVLVNALLREAESPGGGSEFLSRWVKEKEDFFRYLDLAYFHHLLGNRDMSADAVLKAVNFPANDLWGEGGNSEFRGYTAAMCAYRTGHYDAAIRMCDHLLPVRINGNYAKRALRELKQAAQAAKTGRIADVPWDDAVLPFDPFANLDIAELFGRPLPGLMRQDQATSVSPSLH